MTTLRSRIGVEIELIAPPGASRRALADRLALEQHGNVARTFHTDSEASLVPGMGHFWHLTPGFEVRGPSGELVVSLVDDVTLVADLRREQDEARRRSDTGPVPPGADGADGADGAEGTDGVDEHSYRVLSDDARLLRLVADRTDPDTPFGRVLDDVAPLFGSTVETVGAVRRLRDRAGASIALAAALAPGRERPCEIVTPPLDRDHEAALEALLRPARELGFTVPVESAVHLHLDAGPYRSVAAFANLVRLFGHWRDALHDALGTNPSCTRLQPLPPALLELVEQPVPGGADRATAWSRLQAAASATGLSKYFDVNLTALLADRPARDTLEVRILPGSLHGRDVTARAGLVEALLARCLEPEAVPRPTSADPAGAVAELHALAGFIPPAENDRAGRR